MRIALMHFPKTGGTTLHDFIVRSFAKERICPERFNNFDQFSEDELNKFDYFSAHMDFTNLQRLSSQAYTITILREPKDRILSLYYFWKAQSDELIEKHNLVGPRIAKRTSLKEFLDWKGDGIPSNINNYYVRYLIGRSYTAPNGGLALNDENALRVAMRNLMAIDDVGFTDKMHDIMQRTGKLLNLRTPEKIPKARSSENFGIEANTVKIEREDITQDIDERLDDLVRLDKVLYDSARRIFT